MTLAVHLQRVQVRAAERVLLAIGELRIARGERVAVVGPNGAGKSTLLKLVAALRPPAHGELSVLGQRVDERLYPSGASRRALRREVGMLMQGLHLVPRLSARENTIVGALARLHGLAAVASWLRRYPDALVAEADAALAALGLAGQGDVRGDRLSGGERQKVALARLLLQRPRLLLADEPTAALDPAGTTLVCQALRDAVAAPGHTLLAVVHDLELLPQLATRVIGLAGGTVQWDLPLAEATPARLHALYVRSSS
jgi:phosphonate transport system ATP-binding protein